MAKPSAETSRWLLKWSTFLMGQLHRSGLAQIEMRLAAEGLTVNDYYVLGCVADNPDLAQQQVADRMGIDRSDLVRLLDRLEEAGQVARRRDTVDRRRQLLTLTEKGQNTVHHMEVLIEGEVDDLLVQLTSRERRTLHTLLMKALG